MYSGPMASVWMYTHTLHNVKRGRFGASGTLSILESRGGCLRGQCTLLMSIKIKEYIDNTKKIANKKIRNISSGSNVFSTFGFR